MVKSLVPQFVDILGDIATEIINNENFTTFS